MRFKTISLILIVKTNNKQSKERLKTNLKVQFFYYEMLTKAEMLTQAEMLIQAEILNSNNLNSEIPRLI